MDLNSVHILGRLVADPELRSTQSNVPVTQFTVALNRRWTSKDGQKQEQVSFIDCEAWGKQAETVCSYFHKGERILVMGRLKQDKWEADDGSKRTKVKVTVEDFCFIEPKAETANQEMGAIPF